MKSFFNKCLGSGVVGFHLIGQNQLPYLPRKKIEAMRDRRIRRIVRYAAKTVPYYRDLFAREGIHPLDIKGAKELEQLPLIDKELMRSRPELFMSESVASKKALIFKTSGTSGAPRQVYHDRRSLQANIAFGERERSVSIDICGGSFRPKEVYVGSKVSTFTQTIAFYQESVLFPVRPKRIFVSVLKSIETIAEIINRERPDILVGYGGWIDLFFKTVAARNIALKLPKMVMYFGEALPLGAREYIEDKLGIPVLSRYSAAECFKIGFFCKERSGFHIHEDLCHVRIVDSEGGDVLSGIQGEVVISNLINRAHVLLNVPLGDLAAFNDDGCPCGRTLRCISEVEGRTEDILVLADSRYLHPRSIWQIIRVEPDILQYQLIQHELNEFTLDIVAANTEYFPNLKQRILKGLQSLFGPQAQIDITLRNEIPRRPGEKFRAIKSKIQKSFKSSDMNKSELDSMRPQSL